MTAHDHLAAVFAAAAGGADTVDRDRLRRDAVEGGLGLTAGLVGCSITERTGPDFRTHVFAGDIARALDQRQYEVGIGPCVAATRDGKRHVVDDVAVFARSNPRFATTAAAGGVLRVLSVPLAGRQESQSINFYGTASASIRDPLTLARASLLSRAVGRTDTGGRPAKIGETPGAKSAAAHRDLIERAQAVVMQRQRITAEEAFYWLVGQSRREKRSIFATAQAVMQHAGSGDG
jgi:hypothetical protein